MLLIHGLLAFVLIAVAPQERSATPESPDGPVVVIGEVTPPTISERGRLLPLPKKKQKPEVKLVCPYIASTGSLFGPAVVFATISVDYPDENLWCPGVEWYIDSNPQGSHEGDCPPYATVRASEGGEPDRWAEDQPKEFKLWRGEYVIVAKLVKSGRVLAQSECKVLVR